MHVLFAGIGIKCHSKLKWKAKAERYALFQREHGNKGTLWSIRVILLSALILGLDQSEPSPPPPPTPPLPSQLHLVAVSWAGWWSSRQQRPVFSFSYTRIIHESFPGSDVESYCDWTQSFWITCSSYCLNWLVSWCLYLEMVCVDESKWLSFDELFAGLINSPT